MWIQRAWPSAHCCPVSPPQGPPVGPVSWELEVVCCLPQPSRRISFQSNGCNLDGLSFLKARFPQFGFFVLFVGLFSVFGVFPFVFRKLFMCPLLSTPKAGHPLGDCFYSAQRITPIFTSWDSCCSSLSPRCCFFSLSKGKRGAQPPRSPQWSLSPESSSLLLGPCLVIKICNWIKQVYVSMSYFLCNLCPSHASKKKGSVFLSERKISYPPF